MVCAGNRTGKTTSGAWDLVTVAEGYNPIRKEKYPTPNVTWAVPLDHAGMGHIVREKIQQFVPKGTRFLKQEWKFVLPNRSEIHIKSQDAGRDKLQGAGIVKAWLDEEWKGQPGEENFSEIRARRTPIYGLKILYTFTPLNGATWSLRRLWDEQSTELFPGVERFNFSLDDLSISHGGFWTDEQIENFKQGYKPHERDARVSGKFAALGGREWYSYSLLDSALKRCEPGRRFHISVGVGHLPNLTESASGELEIRRPPAKDHRYVVGIDTAGGIRRDYSVANVWDRDDLVCVASYRSNRVPPDIFGSQVCVGLGRHYHYALLVPETNGEHGGTVLAAIRAKQYPHIYQRQEWDKLALDYKNEYGFRTTSRTRSRIFDAFGEALRNERAVFSRDSLMDAKWIVADDDGSPDHVDGYHDDSVVADGVALIAMADTKSPRLPPWSRFRVPLATTVEDSWMNV